MKLNREKSAFLLVSIFILMIFVFQNCGDVGIGKLDAPSCTDQNKELTIVDTTNVLSDLAPDGNTPLNFAVYEKNASGNLVAFAPADPTSQWPPKWFKNMTPALANELEPYAGIEGVIFKTALSETSCAENQIRAEMLLCGQATIAKRNFFVGGCPRNCYDANSGITAEIGEIRDFYRDLSVSCGQACDKIQRECLTNGTFGPPLVAIPGGVSAGDYKHASCAVEVCPTTTTSSSTTTTSTVPRPGIELPGCVPPPIPDGGMTIQWPAFGVNTRVLGNGGQIISYKFKNETQAGKYGSFGSSGFGSSGDGGFSGVIRMTISQSPGCLDESKLPDSCSKLESMPSVEWITDDTSVSWRCPLKSGETYYINFDFGYTPGTECPGQCGRDFANFPL